MEHKRSFLPLSAEEEEIGRAVVNAAYVIIGYLINFNVPYIKDGIRRFIL